MLRILHDTKYDFIKWWRWAAGLTARVHRSPDSPASLIRGGFNYSIEFTGGTLMQLEFTQPPDVARVRSTLDDAGIHGAEIRSSVGPRVHDSRAGSAQTWRKQARAPRASRRASRQALDERVRRAARHRRASHEAVGRASVTSCGAAQRSPCSRVRRHADLPRDALRVALRASPPSWRRCTTSSLTFAFIKC